MTHFDLLPQVLNLTILPPLRITISWQSSSISDRLFKHQFSSFKRSIFVLIPTRVTFIIAEACLLAGSVRNAHHTKYRTVISGNPPSCETLRKGVFGAGAAFVVFTGIVSELYYVFYSKSDEGVIPTRDTGIRMGAFNWTSVTSSHIFGYKTFIILFICIELRVEDVVYLKRYVMTDDQGVFVIIWVQNSCKSKLEVI